MDNPDRCSVCPYVYGSACNGCGHKSCIICLSTIFCDVCRKRSCIECLNKSSCEYCQCTYHNSDRRVAVFRIPRVHNNFHLENRLCAISFVVRNTPCLSDIYNRLCHYTYVGCEYTYSVKDPLGIAVIKRRRRV